MNRGITSDFQLSSFPKSDVHPPTDGKGPFFILGWKTEPRNSNEGDFLEEVCFSNYAAAAEVLWRRVTVSPPQNEEMIA